MQTANTVRLACLCLWALFSPCQSSLRILYADVVPAVEESAESWIMILFKRRKMRGRMQEVGAHCVAAMNSVVSFLQPSTVFMIIDKSLSKLDKMHSNDKKKMHDVICICK